jgi:hypothetical protein
MADDSTLSDPTDFTAIGKMVMDGVLQSTAGSNLPKALLSQFVEQKGAEFALAWKLFLDAITLVAEKYEQGEQAIAPIAERAVGPILAGLFGADAGAGDFSRRMGQGGGDGAARSIVAGFIKAITGGASGPIEPSDDGATRIAAAAVASSIESSINALIPELVSDFLPFDLGKISALTELPEGILRSLGVGRLVRRALTPYVNATCATPALWAANKQYRPTLLPTGVIAKQVARGRLSQDDAGELLARHGYRDGDQDAIINDALKFMGVSELFDLVRAGEWGLSDATQHLTDDGYDEGTAGALLDVQKIRLIRTFSEELALLAVDAFGAGRIDEGTLGAYVHGTGLDDQDAARYTERAHAKRVLTAKPLTSAEAEAAVIAGVLAMPDYRDALRLENRTDDAITTLDLLLRQKLDAKKSTAQHKADQAAELAQQKAYKLAAAQAKQTAHDAAVAAAKRGKPADLKAAYLRGLIPITRVQEAWAPLYDADTVATLTATLEDQRAAIVKQQQARDQAVARAAQRGIDVPALEAAVLNGVLTIGQFRDRLTGLKFDAADADVIAATLQAKMQAAADAKTLHDQAVAAAKVKHIDLPTLELLVRRGHRTIADFNATLARLGYDDVAIAALDDRLQLAIDDDRKAAQLKADAAAKAADKGVSLAQAQRAVVLGITTPAAFGTYLIAAGFDVPAQQTLVAEATADRAAAVAAQLRRTAADARRDARVVPVATLAKAARLGVISPATYTTVLTARGYSSDDVALETDLLTQEIANARAAQQKHAAAAAAAQQKHVSLAQLDAAVVDGALPIDVYTARVIALGFSPADATLIAGVVADKAAVVQAAAARRAALATADAGREASRADQAKAVTDGIQTLDQYRAWLVEQKYGADDVDLEVALLQATLDKAAAKAAGGP